MNSFTPAWSKPAPTASSQTKRIAVLRSSGRSRRANDSRAHLLVLPVRAVIEFHSIELGAIANDCIFGLMGATILK
jgi:hypothetical protein